MGFYHEWKEFFIILKWLSLEQNKNNFFFGRWGSDINQTLVSPFQSAKSIFDYYAAPTESKIKSQSCVDQITPVRT